MYHARVRQAYLLEESPLRFFFIMVTLILINAQGCVKSEECDTVL